MTITIYENPYYDGHNPKWMAQCEGAIYSGDTKLIAVEGLLTLLEAKLSPSQSPL